MPSLFSRIISGEIPSYRIAEDHEFYAFLDINPIQLGHTLVVPKREIDYYFDLEPEELARMQVFAQKVAKSLQAYSACRKVGLAVMGLEVSHAHLHLIPLNQEGDMNMGNKHQLTSEEFQAIASGIRQYIPSDLK